MPSWREVAREIKRRQEALRADEEALAYGAGLVLARLDSDLRTLATRLSRMREPAATRTFRLEASALIDRAMTEIREVAAREVERVGRREREAAALLEDTGAKVSPEAPQPKLPRIFGATLGGWLTATGKELLSGAAASFRGAKAEAAKVAATFDAAAMSAPVRRAVRNVSTLMRQAVLEIAAESRREGIEMAGMTALRQISILDGSTTDICRHYHLATWSLPDLEPLEGSPPYAGGVPRHWRCRSIEVGVQV